jgi:hypothetical protein
MNPDDAWIDEALPPIGFVKEQEDEMQSENINELAAALAVAQGQITGALKGETNSFFNSKYADLASCWDACRKALSENGLAVIQTTDVVTEGSITLVTTLVHKSGQYVRGVMTMSPKDKTPQAFGSCLTYMRRYGLTAIVGVAQVDDDANAASGKDANGIKHTKASPRDGMDLTSHDPEEVEGYARGFINGLHAKDNAKVLELHNEIRSRHEFYTAVGERLTPAERAAVKKVVSENTARTQ